MNFSSKTNNILLVILLVMILLLLFYFMKCSDLTIYNNFDNNDSIKEKNIKFSNKICQKKFDNTNSPSDIKNIEETCEIINLNN